MKHLKTFESFSINEEEGFMDRLASAGQKVKKTFTGHETAEAKEAAKAAIEAELTKLEEEGVSVNRAGIMKLAAENNYLGSIRVVKDVATYVDGKTPVQKAAAGSRYATQRS